MLLTLEALGDIPLGLDVAWPGESGWLALRRLLVLNQVTVPQLRVFIKQRAAYLDLAPHTSCWSTSDLAQCLQSAQDTQPGSRVPTDEHYGLEQPPAEARHWVPPVLARWACVDSALRICPACMTEFGFHSPFYQLRYLSVCPIHAIAFTNRAPCCGRGLQQNPSFETYLCRSCAWTGPQARTLQTRPPPPRALKRFINEYRQFLVQCERRCLTVARDRDGVHDLHPSLAYVNSAHALDDLQQQAARLFKAFGLRVLSRCAARLTRARRANFTMHLSRDMPIFVRPKVKMGHRKYDNIPPDHSLELDDYHEVLRRGARLSYGALERLPNWKIAQITRNARSKAHTVSGRTGPAWARHVTRHIDWHLRRLLIRRLPNCKHLPKVLSTKVPAEFQPRALSGTYCPVCLAFWHWRYAVSTRTGGSGGLVHSYETKLGLSNYIIEQVCSPTLVGVGRLTDDMRYRIPVRLRIALLQADLLRLFAGVLKLYWHEWIWRQEVYPTAQGVNKPPAHLWPSLDDALYWSIEHYRSYITLIDDDGSAQMRFYNWPSLSHIEGLVYCPESV